MLTLETKDSKTSDIKEKIELRQLEANVQNLNNIIIDKTTKIAELEDKLSKISDDNTKLKMDITSTTLRFDERERERVS